MEEFVHLTEKPSTQRRTHDTHVGSARDQAAKVSLRRVDHYHGEHTPGICLESSKNGKLV